MNLLRRVDAWLGLRVFHPPIIWLCQRAGMTQWAAYRYGWWVFAIWAVWNDDHRTWAASAWLILFALARTLSAGLSLNQPVQSSLFIRVALWAFLGVLFLPPDRHSFVDAPPQLLTLVAEYAATITTIPPRRRRERQGANKAAIA